MSLELMSTNIVRVGVWLVAIICAIEGLFTIYYGFTTIYAYSGFTSIFVGVAIMLIAIGLVKKHHIARIGACIIFIISSLNLVFLLYIVFRPNEEGKIGNLGLQEYLYVVYIILAIIAILFLSLRTTREYFSNNST
ncbi:MAG: hypothetical protein ACRBDX_04040 [Gammaproteobacteria bacterium]